MEEINKRDEIVQIQDELDSLVTLRKKLKKAQMIFTIGLLFTVMVYGTLTWKAIRNFDTELLCNELIAHAEKIGPKAARHLFLIGQNVAPVFAKELAKEFNDSLSYLSEKFFQEAVILSEHISADMKRELTGIMDRSLQRQAVKLLETFPELQEEAKFEIMQDNLRKVIAQANDRVLFTGLREHVDTLINIDSTLKEFELKDSPMTIAQLQGALLVKTTELAGHELNEIDWEKCLKEFAEIVTDEYQLK